MVVLFNRKNQDVRIQSMLLNNEKQGGHILNMTLQKKQGVRIQIMLLQKKTESSYSR